MITIKTILLTVLMELEGRCLKDEEEASKEFLELDLRKDCELSKNFKPAKDMGRKKRTATTLYHDPLMHDAMI